MALEEQFPDEGTVSIEWHVLEIDGQRRLSWSITSNPQLDPKLAVALLSDVAAEVEIDIAQQLSHRRGGRQPVTSA